MKKIIGILICTLLIATAFSAVGQINKITINKKNNTNPSNNDEKWAKTFGDEKYNMGVSVKQTSDNGYIILGDTGDFYESNMDFWLIKTDSNGNKIWEKTYGGEKQDWPTSLDITNEGGYIMIGRTHSFDAGKGDIWLIKTDSNGNKIWDKTFGGTDYDAGYDVKQTTDDGFILIGHTSSFSDSRDIWLIKTDSDGNKIWDKTFGGSEKDGGYSVQQTTDGGYILLAETNTIETKQDIFLIKTDSNGEMQWNKIFAEPDYDYAGSVEQTSDGGYIIISSIYKGVTFEDICLIKTDSNGDIIWDKTFPTIGDNMGREVHQTTDGGYIILGDIFDGSRVDLLLIKTDGTGQEVWSKTYGWKYTDVGHSIQQTTDGGYIITGEFSPGRFKDPDLWLIKTDENGDAPNNLGRSIINYRLFEIFPNISRILKNILDLLVII